MPYYDVTNFVTVIKTTIIGKMTCSNGYVRLAVVRIPHEALHRAPQSCTVLHSNHSWFGSLPQTCADASATQEFN
jgi:hypothetical protein